MSSTSTGPAGRFVCRERSGLVVSLNNRCPCRLRPVSPFLCYGAAQNTLSHPGSARDTGARPETEPRRGLRARIALQRDEVCALGTSRAGGNGRTRQHDHVLPHGCRVRNYEGGMGAQETGQGTQASARGQAFPGQPSEPLLGGGLRGKRNKQPPPLDPVQGANVIGPRPGARFRNGLCTTSPRVQTHSPPRSDGGTPARYRRKRGSTRPSAESRTRFPENASCRDRPGRWVPGRERGGRVQEAGPRARRHTPSPPSR